MTNVDTTFKFAHQAPARLTAAAHQDTLGLLRNFVGSDPEKTWQGNGYNMLWRPRQGTPDFFLQLMLTSETLVFTDLVGNGAGIANRGLKQQDIFLGGVAYLQKIKDIQGNDQHFEPGVWCNVPATTNPNEPQSVARMGSIPHGTTINLQGQAQVITPASMAGRIKAASIKPFGGPTDDGESGTIPGPFDAEQDLSTGAGASRSDLAVVPGLTQTQLTNPNLFLEQANAGLTFNEIIEINITSDSAKAGTLPDAGGGVSNIAFLKGKGAGNENSDVPKVSTTFWIQKATNAQGQPVLQLQYTQRVLLLFSGLNWPHVSVATLRST